MISSPSRRPVAGSVRSSGEGAEATDGTSNTTTSMLRSAQASSTPLSRLQ